MAQKVRLFIGSSVENLDIAYEAEAELERDAQVSVWSQGIFEPTRPTLQELIKAVGESDAALFVFAPNDLVRMRDTVSQVVRDNVIFEFGLFIGKLGPERVFFVIPRGEELHLPSDLLGLTPLTFDPHRTDHNLRAALGPCCQAIRRQIRALSPTLTSVSAKVAVAIVVRQVTDSSPGSPKGMPEVLLVRRVRNFEGLDWQFPAGMVKPGDLPAIRAETEVDEETGVKCRAVHELGNRVHPKTHVIIHYFACHYLNGDVYNRDPDENTAAEWVPIPDAKKRLGPDLFEKAAAYLDSFLI